MRTRLLTAAIIGLCLTPGLYLWAGDGLSFRPAPGLTAYVHNPDARDFQVDLTVWDWNFFENRPVELLVKVTAPDGSTAVRRVIEDDGIVGQAAGLPAGGWGHDRQYYASLYRRGITPLFRWSAFTDPGRLDVMAARTFRWDIPGGQAGAYRVMIMGSRDHVVRLKLDPGLSYALAGHPMWLHGHGDMYAKSYVYVPKGTTGLSFGLSEYDMPFTRTLRVLGPDGAELWSHDGVSGHTTHFWDLEQAGMYDHQILTVEVSDGKGDFMLHAHVHRDDTRRYRGRHSSVPALLANDPAIARALQNGAIYHDDQVYWHAYQVRFHDWLKTLDEEDFEVRNEAGNLLEPSEGGRYGWSARSQVLRGLPQVPGYVPLNGNHEAPPLCDDIMHHYPAHRNRQALNMALRDLHAGLRMITVGDMPVVSPLLHENLAYSFASYGWHYWRPAWRVLQHSDAPEEVKEIVREAMILCGDRLAFARAGERVNGNALSHIPMALHYAAQGARDPLLTELADVYLERFAHNEGWGERVGIGPSGDCQEHFAHDFNYGTYILSNYRAINADFNDDRFRAIVTRVGELYRYFHAPGALAYPWSSRTSQAHGAGRHGWHGQPGEDFTRSVHDADEWFAARRANYYILTYSGRLVPDHLNEQFGTKMGYGGGILCQLTVPGHAPVLASQLEGSYGAGMEPHRWRNFRLHSIVGTLTDGRPLVAADSEHHATARLEDNQVTSSGEVRHAPIWSSRTYVFEEDHIVCRAMIGPTRLPFRRREQQANLREAWEMIPYVVPRNATVPVTVQDANGAWIALEQELLETQRVRVDRGAFGVDIVFAEPRQVRLGDNTTVMIRLIDEVTSAWSIGLEYQLHPWRHTKAADQE